MCERDGRLIAHHVYNDLMFICVCFVVCNAVSAPTVHCNISLVLRSLD